ncbi:hypothetical protein CARUB_v10018134mg, partial [Capsella rubella]
LNRSELIIYRVARFYDSVVSAESCVLLHLLQFLLLDLIASFHQRFQFIKMGRGNSCGGGQSSLDYLFGGSDAPAPKPAPAPRPAPTETNNSTAPPVSAPTATALTTATTPVEPAEVNKQIPAGIKTPVNNYARAEGQNTGNFLTDRPSTKVHAAPGGGSSLDYLFTGGK